LTSIALPGTIVIPSGSPATATVPAVHQFTSFENGRGDGDEDEDRDHEPSPPRMPLVYFFMGGAHRKHKNVCCVLHMENCQKSDGSREEKKIEGKERRRMRAQGKKSQKEMLQSSKGQANGNSMTAGRDGQARIKDAGRRTQDTGRRTKDSGQDTEVFIVVQVHVIAL